MESGYMKKALIRNEGYPVGVPAPMHLICVCGNRVEIPEHPEPDVPIACGCGYEYDARGWITKRSPEQPKRIKTRKQWGESKLDLGKFLQVGDLVDEDMAEYFLCVMPPATHSQFMLQIGEPYSHVNGRPTFATLKKTAEGWRYCGNCHIRQTTEPVSR